MSTTRGAIVNRPGIQQYNTSAISGVPTSIQGVSIAGGFAGYIVFAGTKVYKMDLLGVVTDITGAATITAGLPWSIVQAPVSTGVAGQGPVYMVNGTDPPLQWTGSGNVAAWTGVNDASHYSTSPHVPNGQFMVFHGNRIWMCGIGTDLSSVWFSDIVSGGASGGMGDPSSWPNTNFVRFDASDSDGTTGIGKVGPYLVVFKTHKAWIIYDINTGANRPLSYNIGCVAHRSIVPTPEGTFFLTDGHGIYLTDGHKLTEVSYKIRPTVVDGMNNGTVNNACGAWYRNRYYLSFTAVGGARRTVDYDMQLKSWWLHDIDAACFAVFGTNPELAIARTASGGGVGKMNAALFGDYGSPFVGQTFGSAYYLGAWQRFYEYYMRHRIPIPMVKKRVRQVWFEGTGTIIPLVFKDFGAASTTWPGVIGNASASSVASPLVLTGTSTLTEDARLYALGTAEEWSLGFATNTASAFEVQAYGYAVTIRKS